MNKTKIEWSDYTWNPITGCNHPCPYCYARKMSRRFAGDVRRNLADERCKGDKDKQLYTLSEPFITRNGRSLSYPFGFAPTFHDYRLDWPPKLKNGVTIFVCSMADMFGEWVPEKWITRIFDACGTTDKHNYLFLSKNPKRYTELAAKGILPRKNNYWYGTSIPTEGTDYFKDKRFNTFVSVEPIHGRFSRPIEADWIIIGAETGNRKEKVIPPANWIAEIVYMAEEAGTPVFLKDSLIEIVGEENMRRDFPESLKKTPPISDKLQNKLYLPTTRIV